MMMLIVEEVVRKLMLTMLAGWTRRKGKQKTTTAFESQI